MGYKKLEYSSCFFAPTRNLMYNEFYGFSESPFEVAPDPKFLYFTPNHQAVFTSVLDGIEKRKGLISITGEVGTGKTTLIHSLLKRLDEKVKTVFIFHTTITFKELVKSILHDLDIVVSEKGKQVLLNRLHEYLMQMAEDETVAVIIDEAQDLHESVGAGNRVSFSPKTTRCRKRFSLFSSDSLSLKRNWVPRR